MAFKNNLIFIYSKFEIKKIIRIQKVKSVAYPSTSILINIKINSIDWNW